jgi:hypothetical protein
MSMDVRIRRRVFRFTALTVFMAGASLYLWATKETPVSAERTPSDVENILDDLIRRHRVEMSKPPPCVLGERAEGAWALHRLARLLTLASPEVMESLLTTRARDPAGDHHARWFCIALLGELSRHGRINVDATLHELARGSDKSLSGSALRELSVTDLDGRYLELYLSKCHEKVWSAFDAVPFWNAQAAIQEMERFVATSPGMYYPESEMRLSAEEVLEKIRILSSGEYDKEVERILSGTSENNHWLPWAVKAAKMRSLPSALNALRRRLDIAENPFHSDASQEERREFAEMERICGTVAEKLAAGCSTGLYDTGFVDTLIAYAEMGGKLNGIEERRLYYLGYGCDPRKRLDELLAPGK